jgi:hypothetical protein
MTPNPKARLPTIGISFEAPFDLTSLHLMLPGPLQGNIVSMTSFGGCVGLSGLQRREFPDRRDVVLG